MKHFLPVALFATLLSGCGSEGGVSTVESEPPVNHTPVVKWVTKDIDLDNLAENQVVTIPYNIVDPDSDEFTIKVELVDRNDVAIFVNEDEHLVSFTTPYIQTDVVDSLVVTVTDNSGLESQDSVTLTFKETINAAPTLNIVFEQETFKEDGGVLILYALNADDMDGDNAQLDITQTFYSENPNTCLPVCTPVDYSFVQHEGRYAATLNVELEKDLTQFWLHATAEDLGAEAEDVSSFWVERKAEQAPSIEVEIEQSVIHYADEMHFAFDLEVDDADSEGVLVTKNIYMDDPATCRPICSPISSSWSNYKTRHVGTFSLDLSATDTPMWVNVHATDGTNETERHVPFTITKSPNRAPTIEMTLEKSTVLESEGIVIPYNLVIEDPDTPESELELTQALYMDDPTTCRPICEALQATWKQHDDRHVVSLDVVLEHDETFWLMATVTDGEYHAEDLASFIVRKSVNTPPVVDVTLEDDSVEEKGGRVAVKYNMTMTDSNPDDELVLTQLIFDEDPSFCLPLCQPISASFYQDETKHAAEFTYDVVEPVTPFWLNIEVTDGVNTVEKIMPFTVSRAQNVAPTLLVSLEKYTINEDEALRYGIDMSDADGDDITLAQNLYDEDPSTCRPVCQPIPASWLQYEDKYAVEFTYELVDSVTPLWLNVVISDAVHTVESNTTFNVIRQENTPPTLDITLEDDDVLEDEHLRYFIDVYDADEDELAITQLLFDDNPATCRPVCQPINASWSQHENKYALQVPSPLENNVNPFWLEVSVTDGINDVSEVVTFTVRKETNNPPSVAVTLNDSTIMEGEDLLYRVQASDPEGDPLTITSDVYLSNPSDCLPSCHPVSSSVSNSGENYTLSPNWTMTQENTSAWLMVTVTDGLSTVTDVKPFIVERIPDIQVVLDDDVIPGTYPAYLTYTLSFRNSGVTPSSVTHEVYWEDPRTCVCNPIANSKTGNHPSYTATFYENYSAAYTTMWLEVKVTVGGELTTLVESFTVQKVN